MDRDTALRIFDIQESLQEDIEYKALLAEHEEKNASFLEAVKTMTQEQQDAVFDYIGLLVEIHLKFLELAVQYDSASSDVLGLP